MEEFDGWPVIYPFRDNHKNHYVYILFDPREKGKFDYGLIKGMYEVVFPYLPFYVGISTEDRSGDIKYKRITEHQNEFYSSKSNQNILNESSNKIKHKKMMEIFSECQIPFYWVIFRDCLNKEESQQVERALIRRIGKSMYEEGPLTNIR